MVYCACCNTDFVCCGFGGNGLTPFWILDYYVYESDYPLWSENGFFIGLRKPFRDTGLCSSLLVKYYLTILRYVVLLLWWKLVLLLWT